MIRPEDEHLTTKEIHELLGELQEPVERRLLLHLLARCETCREQLPGLLDLIDRGRLTPEASLPEIEVALAEAEAPELWEELAAQVEGLPTSQRQERLARHPRLTHWGLAVWLAEESLRRSGQDGEDVLRMAQLAVAAAEGLEDDGTVMPEYLAELRAFTWASLADSYREAGELDAAEESFVRAMEFLDRHDDPADFLPFRPRVFLLLTRLRQHQGRFGEALLQIDRALAAAEEVHRLRPETLIEILQCKVHLLTEVAS